MTILKSWNVLDCRFKPQAQVYDLILCEDDEGVHLVKRMQRVTTFGGRLSAFESPGETVYFSNKGHPEISRLKAVREVGEHIAYLNHVSCLVVETPIQAPNRPLQEG